MACKSGGGAKVFSVQVDGRTDEFVGAFLAYYPNDVQAHPGDTIDFNSVFNGEPHTVTLGRDVDDVFNLIAQACPNGGLADPNCQQGPTGQYADQFNIADTKLPQFLPEGPGDVIQAAGQPCYLTTGDAPADGSACPKEQQQTQPDFDGTQTYYNSGFLADKAVFSVKLSKDIKPGMYHYLCLLHREGMSGTITVVDKSAKVSSPADQKKKGDDAFNAIVSKVKPAADQLTSLTPDKAQAGASSPEVQEADVNEFGPEGDRCQGGRIGHLDNQWSAYDQLQCARRREASANERERWRLSRKRKGGNTVQQPGAADRSERVAAHRCRQLGWHRVPELWDHRFVWAARVPIQGDVHKGRDVQL